MERMSDGQVQGHGSFFVFHELVPFGFFLFPHLALAAF
jgi:hypothetical protein